MTCEVWKFKLQVGENVVRMPAGSHCVSVGAQGRVMVLWAVVNVSEPAEERRVFVALTGEPLPDRIGWRHFLGTVSIDGFVMHVFDVQPGT